jgi:GDP-4-dehydro-6-deoxy-D-mannose reductase
MTIMRALITGINGFVGGHLAEYVLANTEWEVWGVALESSLQLPTLQERVQCIKLDLCDYPLVAEALAKMQPQVIFHLAGQPFVPESFRNPARTFHININAQLNILLALIEHRINARVLAVGSYEEYGHIQPEDLPIDEATPLRPANPYGVSKVAQDMLAYQYYLSHKLDVVRVRPFNHIGPRQNDRFVASSFARQIASIEHSRQPAVIHVGNLNAQRDFTDVRDMVRAYILAVESGEAGQVYNIGSGTPVKIADLLNTLLAHSSVPIDVQQDPERMRPVDIPQVVCDSRRFQAHTGWEPLIPFEQTLQDILDDWRSRMKYTKMEDTENS